MVGFGAVAPPLAGMLGAGTDVPNSGTIYFSLIGGGVSKVSFNYDPSARNLSLEALAVVVRSLPGGADGMVFDPDSGDLLVGVNGGGPAEVCVVDPKTGILLTSIPTGGQQPSHLLINPDGTTDWTDADPGILVSIPLSPLGNGTAHPLVGNDTRVSTIAWVDRTHAFYTSSGPGGFGQFGAIDLSAFRTTCAKDAKTGSCAVFPGTHGLVYDQFSKTLIMFGSTHVTQIDPATLKVLADITVNGARFDLGKVDGKCHLCVASNTGTLFFYDYSLSSLINATNAFSVNRFVASGLDDVAPLVGAGS